MYQIGDTQVIHSFDLASRRAVDTMNISDKKVIVAPL